MFPCWEVKPQQAGSWSLKTLKKLSRNLENWCFFLVVVLFGVGGIVWWLFGGCVVLVLLVLFDVSGGLV